MKRIALLLESSPVGYLHVGITLWQDFFSNNPKADKIREVQSKVDGIQDIMHENIRTRRVQSANGRCSMERACEMCERVSVCVIVREKERERLR